MDKKITITDPPKGATGECPIFLWVIIEHVLRWISYLVLSPGAAGAVRAGTKTEARRAALRVGLV